jgi:hypothetical protein
MVIDGDLLVEEAVMQGEELVDSLEHDRVDQALRLQEQEEVLVFFVLVIHIFMLDDVVVLLGMPQFVAEEVQVPLWEHTLQVQE